jgi:predicted esterase
VNNVLYRNNNVNPEYGMVLVHGRGADAQDIMSLADTTDTSNFLIAAPTAPMNTWYPYSFLAPIQQNEPYLSESLDIIASLFSGFEEKGIPAEKIILAGFSQGACLSLEYALRNPKKYGGIIAFSGALISDETSSKDHFDNTSIFLGCSEKDPHIPRDKVDLTGEIFTSKRAEVTKKIYPGSFHGITEDELLEFSKMIQKME